MGSGDWRLGTGDWGLGTGDWGLETGAGRREEESRKKKEVEREGFDGLVAWARSGIGSILVRDWQQVCIRCVYGAYILPICSVYVFPPGAAACYGVPLMAIPASGCMMLTRFPGCGLYSWFRVPRAGWGEGRDWRLREGEL